MTAPVLGPLLPPCAVAVETYRDDPTVTLHPAEEALVARAVERRRQEFATARGCAREALARLGVAAGPLLTGESREPLWPAGVVGSLTHCEGYRAAAVARAGDLASLGIDAEPNGPLPAGVLDAVSLPVERRQLAELAATTSTVTELAAMARPVAAPTTATADVFETAEAFETVDVNWDRLLFSAKEAVYKAWFPLARRWLGFGDAELAIDPGSRTFTARLLVPGPRPGEGPGHVFTGRFRVTTSLVVTAVAAAP